MSVLALAAGVLLAGAPPQLAPEVIAALTAGDRLLREERWQEALAAYDRGLAAAPGDASLRFAVAVRLLQSGRPDLSRPGYRLLRELTEIEPDHFAANRILGDWYFTRDFFRESADRYRRALAGKPDDPDTLSNLAISLSGLKRFAEAREMAQKAIAASGGAGRFRLSLAWVEMDWRRNDKALEALGPIDPAALSDGDRNRFYRVRAQVRFQSGDTNGAIADLETATRLSPRYAKGFELLGLYLRQVERYEESVAAYRRTLALEPENEAAHYGLAQAYLCQKKPDLARPALERYRKLAQERQERRIRQLREMSEELSERQTRGWVPGMGGN